ncbi:hypothetical protein KC340_g16261 [Hortaea werneckii]|nr:hypothetical protein KC342_g16529 [Hortaea werneckii]KAI7060329.1 hypothetical protein KC339_g17156 [Hortaea werneckii]KAI7211618.1 hypothetical protein KC365_g14899 [Hortaea werneckii]KAI7294147.1 hypothetical protein KC340_g16261 [Hortaea werneckii]KAI7379337.1 hypothetical protein KC328_g13407 [Hortaea werneckii]
MAPNGTASRKTPAAPTKPSKRDDSGIALESLFVDWEDATPNLKEDVRGNLPVLERPGSWESKVVEGGAGKDAARQPPTINSIPSTLAKAFPNGRLMSDRPNVLRCNHCKRPVLKHAMPAHIERCLNKKQEKQRKKKEAKDARDAAARKERGIIDSDDEEEGASKKTTGAAGKGALTASKKRKAVDENEESLPKKKKKKDADKAKAPKTKAPVDVEKQCGVELPQGGQCARSLTCKSHSMGAKRAVPGRSAPYDKLLMEYQRKNQAKLQKAAFDANAPANLDDEMATGPVDSEEEKDAVMASISRTWGGRPLLQPQPVPLKKKYEYNRIKSMLGSALGGTRSAGSGGGAGNGGGFFGSSSTNGFGAGFFGPATAVPQGPIVDADGVVHPRKGGSAVPGARSMMAPAAATGSRKPSVAAS